MAEKIIMPKQGLQMTEGTIIEWKKKEGDTVEEGEILFEIETDKLNIDIDSPATGTLLAIIRQEGDTVPITEVIGLIGDPGEDVSGLINNHETAVETRVGGERQENSRIITPRARKLAEERNIPLNAFTGTGPEGLIIERDVLTYQSNGAVLSKQPAAAPLTRRLAAQTGQDAASETDQPAKIIPLKGMRKAIAERMRSSLDEAAQAVHRIEIDMSEAVRIRGILNGSGRKISFNDIIIRVVAEALRLHPEMNRQLGNETEILQFSDVNIGVAVALKTGLIVPVIKHADRLGLQKVHAETKRLTEAARSNTLQPDDLSCGRFTVSNLGMYEIDSFTAIINQPESCILAVGTVKDRAVVVDKKIVVRPICQFSLTYDHRIIDGVPAAEFLQTLRKLMKTPYLLV